jgi:hypothetical protein|nr:MAG TPA: hypothetical protein [Caudoviricetes sp.]
MAFGIFGNLFKFKEKVLKVPSALVKINILENTIDLDLLKPRLHRVIARKENDFIALTGRDLVGFTLSNPKIDAKVWPEDVLNEKSSNYVVFISVGYTVEYQYSENTGRLVEIKEVKYPSSFSMYAIIPCPPKHMRKKFVKFNIE